MEELEEKQSKKYRHWIILLYEDSNSYNFKEVMRIIKSNKKYAYIKHFPETNEKKEHFHVIISLDNATKKSTLSKKLGIQENYIDEVKNLRSILYWNLSSSSLCIKYRHIERKFFTSSI